jgi:hypothetical protein
VLLSIIANDFNVHFSIFSLKLYFSMLNRLILVLLTFMVFSINYVFGQKYTFSFNNAIPLYVGATPYSLAWSGGINASEFQKIDLDNDNVEDIVLFDKTSSKISTFLVKNDKIIYAPSYEIYFPKISYWFKLIDFNCDGKKDIFTCGYFSSTIRLYKNISTNTPQWSIETDAINFTDSYNYTLNINLSVTDYPSIIDLDNDGDLEILCYNSSSGSINVFKNKSVENTGNCDGLIYEKYNSCWGRFSTTSSCENLINYNYDCTNFGGTHDGKRLMHNGSSITLLDLNGDNKLDALVGDVGCTNLNAVTNSGDNFIGRVLQSQSNYPTSNSVNLIFPVPFFEDANNDGMKDLVVSPNVFDNNDNVLDFKNSMWYYKNIGTNTIPKFVFQQNNFLQGSMLDVGEKAAPALADFDADGDLDLFVGNRGTLNNNLLQAQIYLYKNTGSKDSAAFTLETDDYLGLKAANNSYFKPIFFDLNQDGSLDFIYSGKDTLGTNSIYYKINQAKPNQPFSFSNTKTDTLLLHNGYYIDNTTNFTFGKINQAELPVLFTGLYNGKIQMLTNIGTADKPLYSLSIDGIVGTNDDDFTKAIPALVCNKLNSSDTISFITLDNTGQLNMYTPFINNGKITDATSIYKQTILNSIDSTSNIFNFGTECQLATGDLDNDSQKEIIVGTQAGGIYILNNISKKIKRIKTITGACCDTTLNNVSTELNNLVRIYPNPASNEIFVDANTDIDVQLISTICTKNEIIYKVSAGNSFVLNTNTFLSGVYMLKIITNSSTFYKKIIIVN